ncbi:MAG: hypothetical protein IH796_11060 [Deltaproteobacteria bacterium]|nr:hypothetical protein [Deltaproteobacteria bacterium]
MRNSEFSMKPPRVYTRGILHYFFGGIRRSTLLRSSSCGGFTMRIHPRAYARGRLRRRINISSDYVTEIETKGKKNFRIHNPVNSSLGTQNHEGRIAPMVPARSGPTLAGC